MKRKSVVQTLTKFSSGCKFYSVRTERSHRAIISPCKRDVWYDSGWKNALPQTHIVYSNGNFLWEWIGAWCGSQHRPQIHAQDSRRFLCRDNLSCAWKSNSPILLWIQHKVMRISYVRVTWAHSHRNMGATTTHCAPNNMELYDHVLCSGYKATFTLAWMGWHDKYYCIFYIHA